MQQGDQSNISLRPGGGRPGGGPRFLAPRFDSSSSSSSSISSASDPSRSYALKVCFLIWPFSLPDLVFLLACDSFGLVDWFLVDGIVNERFLSVIMCVVVGVEWFFYGEVRIFDCFIIELFFTVIMSLLDLDLAVV